MKFSFKEISFLTNVKLLQRFLKFLFLLDISCLSNLTCHCLYTVEFLKSLLETRHSTKLGYDVAFKTSIYKIDVE